MGSPTNNRNSFQLPRKYLLRLWPISILSSFLSRPRESDKIIDVSGASRMIDGAPNRSSPAKIWQISRVSSNLSWVTRADSRSRKFANSILNTLGLGETQNCTRVSWRQPGRLVQCSPGLSSAVRACPVQPGLVQCNLGLSSATWACPVQPGLVLCNLGLSCATRACPVQPGLVLCNPSMPSATRTCLAESIQQLHTSPSSQRNSTSTNLA